MHQVSESTSVSPLVSVIMPTHNRARLVIRTIESVLAQTYGKLEAIVVDDGSTDDTGKAVATFRDDRVRYIRIPHSGLPAVPRNAGLRIAEGEYVAFLDSDDLWFPEKLALQVECFARSPEVGLVCSNALRFSETVEVAGGESELYLKPGHGRSGRVLGALLRDNFVITSTAMVRRACLEQVGAFDESPLLRVGEDYDLWLRIAAIAEVRYVDQPLAAYRESKASVRSRQPRDQYWLGMMRIVQKLERSYPEAIQELQPTVRMALATCHRGLSDHYSAQGRRAGAYAHAVTALRLRPSQFSSYTCLARSLVGRRLPGIVRALVERHWSKPERSPHEVPEEGKVRLHLGCGEVYLPGYVNVDFPPAEHTVQDQSVADVHADFTKLHYAPGSVDEIRLHHSFEHFDRVTALCLLVEWYTWLKGGGKLIIETPDFERSVREFIRTRRKQDRLKLLRHVFGSQEGRWAVHYDGWYRGKFQLFLGSLGYRDLAYSSSEWRGTYSITVTGYKLRPFNTRREQLEAIENLLRLSLVDDSDSEERLHGVWMSKTSGFWKGGGHS